MDHMFLELTKEFHGDFFPFLINHDGIGAVVCVCNHYIGVQLRSSS